ncbi:hypothetical protein [Paenibacillus radicis (ex Xue et al. 2023)]|uniref:Holin n=1 Tax=Paenibacillus radicis (ex Xue et al. 2023) TaxID=2972489 RepID=A0ABT1YDY4_9BACL|nr:hypothetical protein [Paenibacillus radicis (ex Xue et al. 2023)]MCR8631405.1 hypothetical protein [Paenibacillus radicis (ex Xue et al. 2023)]
MWLFIGVAGTLAWTILKEFPRLWRERNHKELWTLALITLAVTALSSAKSLNLELPNPLDWIAVALGPYPRAVYSIFK